MFMKWTPGRKDANTIPKMLPSYSNYFLENKYKLLSRGFFQNCFTQENHNIGNSGFEVKSWNKTNGGQFLFANWLHDTLSLLLTFKYHVVSYQKQW